MLSEEYEEYTLNSKAGRGAIWGQGVDCLIPALDLRSDFPLSTQLCMTLCKAHQAPLSVEFSRQDYLEWVAISFSRGSS